MQGQRKGYLTILSEDPPQALCFLVYLETLHQECAPRLRAALPADGGWPMHVDATGEDGRGTLFAVYAGCSDASSSAG